MTFSTFPLSEITEINPNHPRGISAGSPVSFLGMSSVSEDGTTSGGEQRIYSDVSKGYTPFKNGDILFAKITPCFQNGKIAQADIDHTLGAGSTEFHVIRPRGGIDARYILRFLRQEWIRREGELRMTGSGGQRRVPADYLAGLKVPLPALTEQKRIAAALDQVDTLRVKRRKAIALLNNLVQSIFLDMFGDPVSNTSHWDLKSIGQLGSVVTGNTPPRALSANYGDGIEWIKTDNIRPPELNPSEAAERLSALGEQAGRIVPAESILVTCIAGSPASIGNSALAGRPVAINQQINAFIPTDSLPRFMLEQIRAGKRLIQGKSSGAMTGLVNKSQFSSIPLMVPPVHVQQEFVNRVEKIDCVRAQQLLHLTTLDELFVSLQQRAFSGTLWDHDGEVGAE